MGPARAITFSASQVRQLSITDVPLQVGPPRGSGKGIEAVIWHSAALWTLDCISAVDGVNLATLEATGRFPRPA